MDREQGLARLASGQEAPWDVLVIGGGATGLGAAVEAAARGYRTALVEAYDFAKGTSSRSTKLAHGGVRYLRQGDVSLVVEALRERGRLLHNAPHLVHNLRFVVPSYEWWEGPFYGAGLKVYDLLAGHLGLGASHRLSREETLALLPTVEPAGLRGGVVYHDAQFDDARLAITLARTLDDLGGVPVNGVRVVGLRKGAGAAGAAGGPAAGLGEPAAAGPDELAAAGPEAQGAAAHGAAGGITGVVVRDEESGAVFEVAARVVINACGVFADEVRRLDQPEAAPLLSPSQGVHLVLDRRFLPGDSAVLVPHTDDGRVLFAVPWLDRVVVGTTDTPVAGTSWEPRPLPAEVEFLLAHAGRYLTGHPRAADVLSCFAGLRPLVAAGGHGGGGPAGSAGLSRDHALWISPAGLVTITGGKWTTYRRMGEDAVDAAATVGGLPERPSPTATLRLHGAPAAAEATAPEAAAALTARYGSDAPELERLVAERPEWGERIHPRLPYRAVEVVWAARREMARGVEDVLARRTRALLLDARASAEAAPRVATLLAAELGRDAGWCARQAAEYRELARGYWLES
jgi:glycerol-3-phosphate dehydrogenase